MFVIAGVVDKVSSIAGSVPETKFCPHCGLFSYASRVNVRKWFALFFVRILPMKKVSTHNMQCSRCRGIILE